MQYVDGLQQAQRFAEAALQSMRDAGIPATPSNFTIWYNYVSGRNTELSRTVDILLNNDRQIDEVVTRQLYDEFIEGGPGTDRVVDTTSRIEGSVDKIIENLESAGEGADAYGDALATFSGQLASGSARNVGELIAKVINDTKHMQEQNNALVAQLAQSTGTISELRNDLEAVRMESLTDALTGIGNRKLFDSTLVTLCEEANESNSELCLLLLDIDHFKKFNDTYGHQLGDQVLRLVGRTLRESVDDSDTPARYGGEEFAVLMPGRDFASAYTLADALRSNVAMKRVVRKRTGEAMSSITISGGLALYRPGEPLADLIRRADSALYEAKKAGRDQIQGALDDEDVAVSA